jgi:hypothetical protein
MIVVAGLGFTYGEIKQYYYGTDQFGNMCGDSNTDRTVTDETYRLDLTDETYVYYPDPSDLTVAFCVASCPTVDDLGNSWDFYDGSSELVYPCVDVMNRCLPDMTIIADSDYEAQISAIGEFDDIQSYLDLLSADSWFTRAVADVAELWWLILICISASFVVGLLWMFVVRFFVGMITWIMLVVCFFALLGITLYTWVSSDSLDADSGNVVYEYIDSENLRTVLRVLACVLLGITILYFFLIVFIRKRIKLAIAVIKEASLSLGLTPCLSFFPIFQAFFYVAFIMYWVVVLLFLASAHSNSETIDDIEVMGYKPVVTVMYLGIYHLFGGLWVIY